VTNFLVTVGKKKEKYIKIYIEYREKKTSQRHKTNNGIKFVYLFIKQLNQIK
tara:strand:+ start:11859 stop:12014 length:156 start_codon:yes stop_codon:yes gene_type:complete